MNLIRTSIDRPTAVVSAVIMVVLFGWLALTTIPIQLIPDVNKPVISINTSWPGSAPAEVEREILNRQEEALKGINGLSEIVATASRGSARVTLEFAIGTNMDKALLLVANRLDRVTGYPEEVDRPTFSLTGSEDRPIAWFVITRKPGNTRPIYEYGDLLDSIVRDNLERVNGVSEVSIRGASERELRVIIKPENLARYGLTVSDLVTALRRANASMSAGDIDEGKRTYIVRTEGELTTPGAVRQVVVRSEQAGNRGVGRVTIGDIAEVAFGYSDPPARIRQLGEAALAFNVKRETGANVIKTMDAIRIVADELAKGPLDKAGLIVRQVYDETVYIGSAVDLVKQNIWVGGSLAAIVLLIFLRSWRATLIVSLAIPVSVIGSFVAMAALGRSLNVISLAGLAFAVGMVVDAAIVVLENIFRLRERKMSAPEAAYVGTRQVWGAVFVSALTTVLVFIPILVLELEVGQLFRDIAVAISVSVLLSLAVSATVIPALSRALLKKVSSSSWRLPLPGIDHLGRGLVTLAAWYAGMVSRSRVLALLIVVAVSVGTSYAAITLLPPKEYLPNGNRNLLFGILAPPPGYNLATMNEIAQRFEKETQPLWGRHKPGNRTKDGTPYIDRFFFVATNSRTFIGVAAKDPALASQLVRPLNILVARDPDTLGGVTQSSLFGRGLGSTRQIDLDITGPNLVEIYETAARTAALVSQLLPRSEGNRMRPSPALSLGAPELRIIPNRAALADAGLNALTLGQSIDAFNDGLRVAEVTIGNDRVDLILKGETAKKERTQGIDQLPVVTPDGSIVPVSSLANVKLTSGPTQIRHKERLRTVTLLITPRSDIPLENALDMVRTQIIQKLEKEGLPDGVRLRLSGTADKLNLTWNAMQGQLLIALVIVYLVMAILFESFVYPLIIMLSVPLAAAGGVGGLVILNQYMPQNLDMLTMLGFVILIGIVVNNAILLVHQTLQNIRFDGLDPKEAVIEATRSRMRPIFMSTLTSIFGMLPLVVLPGAGSELYRGLGSVVVGGLSVSALMTIIVIPPMLSLLVGPLEARRRSLQNAQTVSEQPAE